MTNRKAARLAITLALANAITSGSAIAQITARWFDINPSHSNDGQNGSSNGRTNHVGAAGDFSKVYAATEWGGLYQSFDQGNSWVRVNTFSPSAAWDVKVDPRNSQKVYATSSFDGRLSPQSGVSVSNDAGASWTPVNVAKLNTLTCGLGTTAIAARKTEPGAWGISINPANTAIVFAGTNCGLARTIDAGVSWTFIDPSPADLAEQVYAVVAQSPQIVDVITDNGHFRSVDNGAHWTAIPSGAGPVPGNSGVTSSIAASPAESYVLLAATAVKNIFESDNGGTTWPSSLTLPPGRTQGRIPFIRTNQLSNSSQFDVWYGDVSVFKTTATTPGRPAPGGSPRTPTNSWNSEQDGAHNDVGDLLFDPRFAAGACPKIFTNDGGVYNNPNPNNPGCQAPSWNQPNVTMHATWMWGFDGVRVGSGVHALTYGLQDDGGYAATNVMEGFNPPEPGWNNYACCDLMTNAVGSGDFVSLEGAATSGRTFPLYTHNLDGSNSNQISNYPSPQNFTAFVGGKQAVSTGGNAFVVNVCSSSSCVGGDVYATPDITAGNISWTSLGSPTAVTTGTGSLKVASFNGQTNVFYHTGNGNPEAQGVIFRSGLSPGRGAGSNWVPLPLPPGIVSVIAWDVDPTNGNHIIIAGINAASNLFQTWLTQDFGAKWTALTNLDTAMLQGGTGATAFLNQVTQGRTSGSPGVGTYWQPSLFKFDPLNSSTIVAGAIDAGIYLSIDNGSNWSLISKPVNPTSQAVHIPRPLFAYFSPGRFAASTNSFDLWVGTRGLGVMKVVVETPARSQ